MNGQEMLDDAQLRALETWEREQRTKKRRAALVVVAVLVAGFAAAAVVGHSYRTPAGAQATSLR